MKNVLSKLAAARLFIKAHPVKKDGKNNFSNYDYFTPEMVTKLVNDACVETNSIAVFSLERDEHGYYGKIVFTDLESGETTSTTMRTEKPTIKATNETQQMGGMQTYTKRYALMSLFDIEDNSIDFDSQDNTKPNGKASTAPAAHQAQQFTTPAEKPWLNRWADKEKTKETAEWGRVLKAIVEGVNGTVYKIADVKKRYRLSKELEEELKAFEKKS